MLKKGDLDRHMAELLTARQSRRSAAPPTRPHIGISARPACPPDLLHDLQHVSDTRGRAGVVEFALRVNAKGPPFQLALLHGEAGNLDEAFRYLDAAISLRDPALVHLAVAPQWDCLRGDERFGERLQAMGLAAAADRAERFLQLTMPPRAAT